MRMAERKPRVAEFTESELLLPAIELELLFALVDK
jgi:hypothetical protein